MTRADAYTILRVQVYKASANMRASRDIRLTQAFVLTDGELRKLVSAVSTDLTSVTLSATCDDGLERSFSNVDELAAYENPPKKSIRSLRVRTSSENYRDSCLLRLEDSDNRNIFLSLESDEERVLKLSEILEERLAGMRPWYHWIARSSAALWVFIPYWIFFIINPSIRSWFQGNAVLPTGVKFTAIAYWTMGVMALMVVLVIVLVSKFKRSWFPMGVFAIGQGNKRYHDRDILRTSVIVAFAISVIAGFFTSWMT